MEDVLFVLGAMDPEMEMIERIISRMRLLHCHATANGEPVHSGNAYKADRIEHEGTLVFIECAFADGRPEGSVVIDHHREGDPGYGVEPDQFFKGSSLGQVLAFLAASRIITERWATKEQWRQVRRQPTPQLGAGWCQGALAIGGDLEKGTGDYTSIGKWVGWFEPPHEITLTMASDHCVGAAYKGQCPGVSPEAMRIHRTRVRSNFQGISPEELEALVSSAETELEKAPEFSFGLRDMRRDIPVPELPEAALRKGSGYISGPLVGKDGRKKFTCSGDPEQVKAFLSSNPLGLEDVYGDPARGFAGGYEK